MSRSFDRWAVAIAAIQLSTRLIDAIQVGVHEAGFTDVTPLHGFAFARIAGGDATIAELAEHLGVSKQAAAQLAERLVKSGYASRHPHPRDRRAQLLRLTSRGHACTMAARRAAEQAITQWRRELPADDVEPFEAALLSLTASITGLRPPQ